MSHKSTPGSEPIYDARTLGLPKMLVLGLQHLFAMFGATVLVPILVQGYGLPLSIQTTLFFAGIGTLFFHICTRLKVPAFLGSSFAYLGGFSAVAALDSGAYATMEPSVKLQYACGGIVVAGLLYVILAAVIKLVGVKKVMRFLPPVVTGPIIFLIGLAVCYFSELAGNPKLAEIGLSQSMGSMEGKEVRFGIAQSALFTTVTTSFTTGTVNNMHDTLTPLGGMVPLLHMMLNCVFGGKGVGLMNMIMYVMLGVFLCGLMIGRTPEYLGKKVEGREMKMAVLVLIIHPLLILGFSALAVGTEAGRAGITNPGFHGLSQVLYEYSSSAANNGSGFEGLADNTYFWNITAGLAMFFGRYLAIVLQLAIAWSLLCKKRMNESIGTLKTNNIGFGVIVAFVVYIFAALTFFPALALGPIAEHLSIWLPV